MKLICAGLPKTGTTSLAAALTELGYSVHDYVDHYGYHTDEYIKALEGEMPDFATMYADIDAVLDSPPCLVWDEILRCFPDAKVIIQERDNVDVWLKSFLESSKASKTTQNQWWVFLGFAVTPSGRKWKRLIDLERLSYRNMDTKFLLELYTNCHNARVKALVPRDKLLVYNIKQGWEPLCEFLGVQVPDKPFPRLNVRCSSVPDETNQSISGRRMFNELVFVLAVITVILAVVIWNILL